MHFRLSVRVANIMLLICQGEETCLHIAARTSDGEKVADMLLKSGADVNATKQVPA